MKRKIVVLTTMMIAFFMATNNHASAQDNDSKSNGIIEIIALFIPDSVVFKPAEGIEIAFDSLSVFLVSEERSYECGNYNLNGSFNVEFSNGRTKYTFVNETRLRAFDFKAPIDFKAQKIKFVVGKKDLIYDIINSKWE